MQQCPNDTPRLSDEQLSKITSLLGAEPRRVEYLTSGAAHHVFRAHLASSSLILKLSKAGKPDLFIKEAHALGHLAQTGTVHVPAVEMATDEFLMLEDLGAEHQGIHDRDWLLFGAQFGRLHQVRSSHFGYEHDNYLGIWDQSNRLADDWADFYYRHRVHCFLDVGRNADVLTKQDRDGIERLFARMKSIVPPQQPALCHGDFWINNIFRKQTGKVYVIDPAIHFGLPEADLAMTQMYGAFPDAFYEGYRSESPLQADWKDRLPLYQLKELLLMMPSSNTASRWPG